MNKGFAQVVVIGLLGFIFVSLIGGSGYLLLAKHNEKTIEESLKTYGNLIPNEQFTSTTSPSTAITQRVYGKAIRLTGLICDTLTNGGKLTLDSNGFIICDNDLGSGGGGGGGGAHSTSTAFGTTLYVRPNNATDIYALGYDGSGVATSSNEAEYVADPTFSKTAVYLNGMKLGIGTTSPYAALSVVGETVGTYFTATGTRASTFPYASSTGFSTSYASSTIANLGTIFTGLSNGFAYIGSGGKLNSLASSSILLQDLGGAVTDAQVPNSITVTLAGTATALAANGANCSAGSFPLGVDASGAVESCAAVSISGITNGNNLADLTATNATLTFSGAYNGGTARTIGLNLGNPNTWTVLQTFNYSSTTGQATFANASSTQWEGGGLQACNATTGKLNWNATTKQFTCDTDQNTGGGGGSGNVATSSAETSGYIPFWTSTGATPATLSGGVSSFTFNSGTPQLVLTKPDTGLTPLLALINSSTGDASAYFNVFGGADWVAGIDNSDSDAFKIQPSTSLSTGEPFRIDTTGRVTFTHASSTYSSFNHASTTNFTFGGVTGNDWADFCTAITGSSDLCDGSDASGTGGSSAYEIATTSDIALSQVAYISKVSGRTTLASVATSTPTIGASLSYTGTMGNVLGGSSGTLSLNTANANTWSVLQTFNYSSSTAYSSFNVASTTNFIVNGQSFNDLTGEGLTIITGALTVDDVPASSLASADFGSFTCNGLSCLLDNGSVDLTTKVTGTLPIANGGTATTTGRYGGLYFFGGDVFRQASTTGLLDYDPTRQLFTTKYSSSTEYASFKNASSTNYLGAGLQTCDPTTGKLTWSAGQFGCGTDFNTGGGGSDPFSHTLFGGQAGGNFFSATTSMMAIGTSTATNNLSALTVSSSTASQFALSAGAGLSQWTLRNAGGNLYFSTTTVAGTATSSVSAFSINTNGFPTFPSLASSFAYFNSSGTAVGTTSPLFYERSFSNWASTTPNLNSSIYASGATSTLKIYLPRAVNFTGIGGSIRTGTSILCEIGNGTASTTRILTTTAGATSDSATLAGEVTVACGSGSSNPDDVNFTVYGEYSK